MTDDEPTIENISIPCAQAGRAARAPKRSIDHQAPPRAALVTASNALRLKGVLSHLPHLVWETDLSGQCTYVNQVFEDFTGADTEELTNTSWANFLHPDDVAATTEGWLHSIRHRTAHQTHYRLRRHDGTYQWMLARAILVQDTAGNASHWIGTNTDVHELYQRVDAAHERRSFEQHFVRDLANDFRTPLGVIESTAESALNDTDDPRAVRKSLRAILKNADRLDAMVEDLLCDETR